MSFQRIVQTLAFGLFLGLILAASFPLPGWLPVKAFALLDPILLPAAMLATRTLFPWTLLLPLILLLLATVLTGRFFCSHLCPLGFMQDLTATLNRQPKPLTQTWPSRKYLILLLVFVAGIYGWNVSHFVSPVSLAQRLAIMVLIPGAWFVPFPALGLPTSLARFQGQWVVLTLAGTILFLAWRTPRFWCRTLCPAGALLALFGRRPVMARQVNDTCTHCGACAAKCPMGAIDDDPALTQAGECTTCLTCQRVCPASAISFSPAKKPKQIPLPLPSRRAALVTMAGGFGLAFTARAGLHEFWSQGEVRQIMPKTLIRPPGSRPEPLFLNLCLRCGLCIKVCPTNMLQPAMSETGLSGFQAPLAMARRGPCEPLCHACGQVCPSGAIAPLSLEQKAWAKMGTAVIQPNACLAWEQDKPCLVCDEACPFDAIELKKIPDHKAAVPVVTESKCAGCGYCENKCPVQAKAAIRVTPMGALRLEGLDYQTEAKRQGLSIRRTDQKSAPAQPVPSVTEPTPSAQDLPPGFSSD